MVLSLASSDNTGGLLNESLLLIGASIDEAETLTSDPKVPARLSLPADRRSLERICQPLLKPNAFLIGSYSLIVVYRPLPWNKPSPSHS